MVGQLNKQSIVIDITLYQCVLNIFPTVFIHETDSFVTSFVCTNQYKQEQGTFSAKNVRNG